MFISNMMLFIVCYQPASKYLCNVSVSLSWAALKKAFASSGGIRGKVDEETIDFRSLFDGPRNRSRRSIKTKIK